MKLLGTLQALEAEIVSIIERAGELIARPCERRELDALVEELKAWDVRAARAGVRLDLVDEEGPP